jgi:hypothetical protein
MRFEFQFSDEHHFFSPYKDKYWSNPGIAMSAYSGMTYLGSMGVTIITDPRSRLMVIDPICLTVQSRGSLLLFVMIRKLHNIAVSLKVPRFVLLCMHDKPEQLPLAKKLGCIPYANDSQGVYVVGNVPLLMKGLVMRHVKNEKGILQRVPINSVLY